MDKSLNIAKRDNDSYSAAFETPEGRLTCVISVARQEGASDRRTPGEKKKEAHKKLQRLAEDFSIVGDEEAGPAPELVHHLLRCCSRAEVLQSTAQR